MKRSKAIFFFIAICAVSFHAHAQGDIIHQYTSEKITILDTTIHHDHIKISFSAFSNGLEGFPVYVNFNERSDSIRLLYYNWEDKKSIDYAPICVFFKNNIVRYQKVVLLNNLLVVSLPENTIGSELFVTSIGRLKIHIHERELVSDGGGFFIFPDDSVIAVPELRGSSCNTADIYKIKKDGDIVAKNISVRFDSSWAYPYNASVLDNFRKEYNKVMRKGF